MRASSAAPTIFPAQEIEFGTGDTRVRHVFVDGGVSSYNNPAFQLFLQATLEPYRLCWKTGEDDMLLVSVGTGLNPGDAPGLTANDLGFYRMAKTTAVGLFNAAIYQQDLLCRAFGRCVSGDALDREVGALIDIGCRPVERPLFTYARYNAELTDAALAQRGLGDIRACDVCGTDETRYMDKLMRVGREVARSVDPALIDRFMPGTMPWPESSSATAA
jgi:hypothetical protein